MPENRHRLARLSAHHPLGLGISYIDWCKGGRQAEDERGRPLTPPRRPHHSVLGELGGKPASRCSIYSRLGIVAVASLAVAEQADEMSLPSLPTASMTSQSAELYLDPPRRPNEELTARVSTVPNSGPTTVAAQLEVQAAHPSFSWPATGHVQDMPRIPSEQPDAPPSELTQLPDLAISANAQPYTIVEPTGGRADRSSPPSLSLEPTHGTDSEPQNATVVLPRERHFSTSFVKATGVRYYVETTRHGDGQCMVVSFMVLDHPRELADLPNEVLLEILGHLDVYDLLSTSRVSVISVPSGSFASLCTTTT